MKYLYNIYIRVSPSKYSQKVAQMEAVEIDCKVIAPAMIRFNENDGNSVNKTNKKKKTKTEKKKGRNKRPCECSENV